MKKLIFLILFVFALVSGNIYTSDSGFRRVTCHCGFGDVTTAFHSGCDQACKGDWGGSKSGG